MVEKTEKAQGQIWQLIEHITSQVDELMQHDNQTKKTLDPLASKLKRLIDLHKACSEQEVEMRIKMLGLMRERNLYLEKCWAIEQFGEKIDWQGSNDEDNGLLAAIHEVLYQQQDEEESMEDEL